MTISAADAGPGPRPDFRADLEGVRGLAVLLVVGYHAGVPALAGGFVGVDLFFVLSGYFITALLAREVSASGGVDLAAFYGRRSLRLVPPLLVVLASTLGLVFWLWAPIDRPGVAASARAAALGAPNVHFARESVDYFSTDRDPLLHTWSLGVEQQFYLAWPLVVLGAVLAAGWWAGRRGARGGGAADDGGRVRTALLAAAALVGGLSFALALRLTETSPGWAFFGAPARGWEFALGAALAVAHRAANATTIGATPPAAPDAYLSTPVGAVRRDVLGTALQAAGLAAVAVAVTVYDGAMPYPGAAALVPALAAAALVAGGRLAPDGPVSRLFGVRPLLWLGGVSYAWYLWHWPLVGAGAVLDPGIGVAGRLAWSALALGLAWLTARFVERPARGGRLARLSPGWQSALAFAAGVVAFAAAHVALQVAERRVRAPDQRAFALAREDRMLHDCWATTVDRLPPGPCAFGDTTSRTVVALLGDSHAEHWLGALDRAGRERGWKVLAMVKGGCPVADAPDLASGRRAAHGRACAAYREAMVRRVLALRPAAVVLSSWDHYVSAARRVPNGRVSPAAWRDGLRRTYARFAGAGIPTVVVRGTPRTGFDVPGCLSRRAAALPFARACDYSRDSVFLAEARAAQAEAAAGLAVRVVDMNDQVCPPGPAAARCPVVRGGAVVFTDDNHLTASFSRSVGPVFGARVAAAAGALGARLP